MKDIDPHWSTGDEDVSSTPLPEKGPSMHAIAASRRPAALTGIVVVFLIGFALTQGLSGLLGQAIPPSGSSTKTAATKTSNADIEVHITANGTDPKKVQVHPGETISWINDQDMPHILTSDQVKDGNGAPLHSPAIFPGASYAFTLGADQQTGTFSYVSQTSQAVSGDIEVIGGTTAQADTSSSTHSSVQAAASSRATASSSEPAVQSQDGLIPRNPYTITNNRDHPFDAQGNPIDSVFDKQSGKTLKSGAPSQPESGMNAWGILGGSMATFLWITRKYFQSGVSA